MHVVVKAVFIAISAAILVISVLLAIFKQIEDKKRYTHLCIVMYSFAMVIALISSLVFFDFQEQKYREYYGKEDTLEAVILSSKYESNFMSSYQISVERFGENKDKHNAVLLCEYDAALEIGDKIIANVNAESPDNSVKTYNERLSMMSDGMFVLYVSDSADTLNVTDSGFVKFKTVLSSINEFFSGILTKAIGGEEGNLSSALFLGNKALLSSSVRRDFSRAGAAHILALSGMHMSIIMGAAMYILRRITVRQKLIAIVLSIMAFSYLAITGFSISATRSVIMLLIVYLSILVEGIPDSLTSLSLAGALILLISPGAVIDPAFWMSFAATLGILVYMPGVNSFFSNLVYSLKNQMAKTILKPVLNVVTIFFTGIFAMLPLIAVMSVFIREISAMSIISTVVLSLPTAIMIIVSMLLIPLSFIPYVSGALAAVLRVTARIMVLYCSKVSQTEGIVLSLNYPFAWVFAVLLVLGLLYSFLSRHKNFLTTLIPCAICILMLVGTIVVYEHVNKNNVRVSYINASSNSDMVVATSGSEAIICDISNGSKSSYSLTLDETSQTRATEIRSVILTRYTYSHNATFYKLFQEEIVRELWLPEPQNYEDYCIMERLYDTASMFGVVTYVYDQGDKIRLFDYTYMEYAEEYIDRSAVPISLVTLYTAKERFTYISPSFNESELSEHAENIFSKTDYLVFGNRGPKTKTPYAVSNIKSIDVVVFSDETRVAYYQPHEYGNPAFVLADDKYTVIMEKN